MFIFIIIILIYLSGGAGGFRGVELVAPEGRKRVKSHWFAMANKDRRGVSGGFGGLEKKEEIILEKNQHKAISYIATT